MLLAALFFARRVGDNALRLGLADALAGVRFDGVYGGEGLLFGAFLRHARVFSGIPAVFLNFKVTPMLGVQYEILAGE